MKPNSSRSGVRHVVRVVMPAIVAGLIAFSVAEQPARGASSTVVISEFRVRGPNGGSDEFVELYNLSASAPP